MLMPFGRPIDKGEKMSKPCFKRRPEETAHERAEIPKAFIIKGELITLGSASSSGAAEELLTPIPSLVPRNNSGQAKKLLSFKFEVKNQLQRGQSDHFAIPDFSRSGWHHASIKP
jgi:hypothetical protein